MHIIKKQKTKPNVQLVAGSLEKLSLPLMGVTETTAVKTQPVLGHYWRQIKRDLTVQCRGGRGWGGVETSSCLYKRRPGGIESVCVERKPGHNVAFDVCVCVCARVSVSTRVLVKMLSMMCFEDHDNSFFQLTSSNVYFFKVSSSSFYLYILLLKA